MKVTLADKSWDFDEANITLKEAFAIKAASGGLPMRQFIQGLYDADPLCLQVLVWFIRRGEEPTLRPDDVDFRLADLDIDLPPVG